MALDSGYLFDRVADAEREPPAPEPELGAWATATLPGVDTDADETAFNNFRREVLSAWDGIDRVTHEVSEKHHRRRR